MLDQLRNLLMDEDTVLFVGSGISRWSGLPSWSELLLELADHIDILGHDSDLVRQEVAKGDLLQAASYGFDQLTPAQIGQFVRSACRVGKATPHAIHQKLVTLGPRFFVTTNYDDLLEQSVRKFLPDEYFPPPVTNRHLSEMADIVYAKANRFIFKPHGDCGDTESLILTREQYRLLLPQGPRHAALESLRTLMATRPVIYVGFGLRDPDFLLIRDVLANTYQGGTRDHYAIMADVSQLESDYWRRNYGIHLVSYSTGADASRPNHSALLALLDELHQRTTGQPTSEPGAPSEHTTLVLARYAARLSSFPRMEDEFDILVYRAAQSDRRDVFKVGEYDGQSAINLLTNGPSRTLLLGSPGSGKSYAMRSAAARLAHDLERQILSSDEGIYGNRSVVPLSADLKLYDGSLVKLLEEALPSALSFEGLYTTNKLRALLDSFDELPRELREAGAFESDLRQFLERYPNCDVVVSSRMADGFPSDGFETYEIEAIGAETVINALDEAHISLEGPFSRELASLLRRPFYFRLFKEGVLDLPSSPRPRDLFSSLLSSVVARSGDDEAPVMRALELVAYNALDRGEETFPTNDLSMILSMTLGSAPGTKAADITNHLISSHILVPYHGGRLAFVHKSITEYLAATELARRYGADPAILSTTLLLRRWDQAIFLALSLMPEVHASRFLDALLRADYVLAISAVRYLEFGRDEVISKLLDALPEALKRVPENRYRVDHIIEMQVPFTAAHLPRLRNLLDSGSSVGGAIAAVILRLDRGSKAEMVALLGEKHDDYNLCINGIGPALRSMATVDDIDAIVALAASLSKRRDANIIGFVGGAAVFLSRLDVDVLLGMIDKAESREHAEVMKDIVARAGFDRRGADAVRILLPLAKAGHREAIFYLGLALRNSEEPQESQGLLDGELVKACLGSVGDKDSWSLNTISEIVRVRPDLKEIVVEYAKADTPLVSAALMVAIGGSDRRTIFNELRRWTKSPHLITKRDLSILEHHRLDWTDYADLFVSLLQLRDLRIVQALCGGSVPPTIQGIGSLEFRDIDWWLDWIVEAQSGKNDRWLAEELGAILGALAGTSTRSELLRMFNAVHPRHQGTLRDVVLPYLPDLTTDELSEPAISSVLAWMERSGPSNPLRGNLLGQVATEAFVQERLLPLLSTENLTMLGNLRSALRSAGARHGRRYVLDS